MGKLNFRGYLISRFFATREIRENLMHAKNTCFTVVNKNVSLLWPQAYISYTVFNYSLIKYSPIMCTTAACYLFKNLSKNYRSEIVHGNI